MSINVCNDRSMASITSLPSGVSGSSLVLISEQTASSSSNISFTSGIDSTYKEYVFKFINIHPSSNGARFNFNISADSGSNYNVSKTSTYFNAYHTEDDTSSAGLSYNTGGDLANGTGDQNLFRGVGAGNDEALCGELHLFDPSSTTFVKHFIASTTLTSSDPGASSSFVAGYGNTTSAIDAIKFLFHTGNIDAGTIKMYGVV